MNDLTQKKCVACEGNVKPMDEPRIKKYLAQVKVWALLDGKVKKIAREFKFKNFKEAMAFVNKVADLAESEGHHPDILVHGWNNVRITLYTHAIGGLSENDFIMAAKAGKLI